MKIFIKKTNYLNSGQGMWSVALTNHYVRRSFNGHNLMSKNAYFAFLGGLHTKQFLYGINGGLVKGAALDEIIESAGLTYIGLGTAFTDESDILRNQYILSRSPLHVLT